MLPIVILEFIALAHKVFVAPTARCLPYHSWCARSSDSQLHSITVPTQHQHFRNGAGRWAGSDRIVGKPDMGSLRTVRCLFATG
jgi:hypothetical protein